MPTQSSFTNLESFWKDDFTPLEDAGKTVLQALRDDEKAPDADLYRRIGGSGSGSHRYFSATEALPARTSNTRETINNNGLTTPTAASAPTQQPRLSSIPPPTITMKHERSVPLPPFMAEKLKTVKSHSLMGLLPEAELAWMSVDDKLFLWPYTSDDSRGDGPSFCSFTIPSGQCVLSVGLVRPKKGVFKETVRWCLVVTNPEEVILCALASDASDGNDSALFHRDGSFRLVPTKFNVPTDSVRMLSVCGTSDGRIFLGGEDGCLYEIDYEGLNGNGFSSRQPTASMGVDERLELFYDYGKTTPSLLRDGPDGDYTDWVVAGGKRVLSSVVFGSTRQDRRPNKCRKLNHSSNVVSIASAVVPDFLIKATSHVFGGKSSSGGGSIVKMVIDEERSCLYTLGSKGWICAFHLTPKGNNEARLEAVMNTPETARLYLDAVARQRMTPPSSHSSTIGHITFPGSGSAAQAGVGGMEGARNILSLSKFGDNSRSVLCPVDLHVVPRKESGRITLVAITRGGLRYYISSLSPQILTSGFSRSSEINYTLAPTGRRLSLCHIRAPPPVSEEGRSQDISTTMESDDGIPVGGFIPKMPSASTKMPQVDASLYSMGAMALAVGNKQNQDRSQGSEEVVGDRIIGVAPDSVLRKVDKAPGGVSETLSSPMNMTYGKSSSNDPPVLPGGIIWDIALTAALESNAFKLTLNSATPTDNELSVGLVPEFIPSSGPTKSQTNSAVGSESESASRSQALRSRGGGLSAAAMTIAFNMVPNLLLSRPIHHGIKIQKPSSQGLESQPSSVVRYRVSKRYGTTGFSLSAADISANKKDNSLARRSPRLNPWLLRPSVVPLNPLTIQHLMPPSKIVAMNAGGLEYFHFEKVLTTLEEALMMAGANVERDEYVTSFFTSYGHAEGCAMCLLLAIGFGTVFNHDLRERALSAALARAFTPKLTPVVQGTDGLVTESSSSDPLLPEGYNFRSSALLDGINKVTSRLLRPVWHKAFVVVTEGRTVQLRWKTTTKITPAKVELLLDEKSLEDIVRPLHSLMRLMRDVFSVAIDSVPGLTRSQTHMMDIDEDNAQNQYLTNALIHQNHLRNSRGIGNGQLAPHETEMIAKLTEERKIHSIYRLISRSVQLLRLLSLLSRAHFTPGLSVVEWGSLHGLTVSQLVQTREGQDRLEKLLNTLVTSTTELNYGFSTPSAKANDLANQLADQCYLFFSPGSRFAYLGFRLGKEALLCQMGSARRNELTIQAADHFRRAAAHWHSSSLVTGKSLNTKEQEGYEKTAISAHQNGSPLAKAVSMLVQLGDVDSAVEVCLITSSNFGGSNFRTDPSLDQLSLPSGTLPWEHDLYHKRREGSAQGGKRLNGSSSASPASPSKNALALGTTVTSQDAITTCWALIFYHVSNLLQSSETHLLAEKMVSRCAAENSKPFLHAFFRFMLDSGNSDTLLRIDSRALEDWLQQETRDPYLLYMYYMKQENYFNAGKVAADRAYDKTIELPLSERIEYLSRAYNAYLTAQNQREHGSLSNFVAPHEFMAEVSASLAEVKDRLDIARLQNRVLHAVISSDPEAKEDIKELSTKLVDVSSLFNDYAAQRRFSDICLLILHSCRKEDTNSIESLWRAIFCEELFPCCTRKDDAYGLLRAFQGDFSEDELVTLLPSSASADDSNPLFENGNWVKRLEKRIISLGKQLYGSGADYTFPVGFIFANLESLRRVYKDSAPSHVAMQSPSWSLRIFVEIGVPYMALLDACENWADQEDNELLGSDDERRFDQLKGIVSLLNDWVSAAKHSPKAMQELSQAYNGQRLSERYRRWAHELERSGASDLLENLESLDNEMQYLLNT